MNHAAHTSQIPPHTVEEIGRLVTVGTDWAGTLARLLHRDVLEGATFGEETVLSWAAGLDDVPPWATAAMGRLLAVRAGLLRQQAERCDVVGSNLRGK